MALEKVNPHICRDFEAYLREQGEVEAAAALAIKGVLRAAAIAASLAGLVACGGGDQAGSANATAPGTCTAGAAGSPSSTYFDINHVLGAGQSLSVGTAGSPRLTGTQPYDNLTFSSGVVSGGTGLTSLVPLIENSLSEGRSVETPWSAFANLVTKAARESVLVNEVPGRRTHDLLVSSHGVGGVSYAGLKKGTQPFANGMAQVAAGLSLARAAGKSYVVRAVAIMHGESDHIERNSNYQANLVEWYADYAAGIKAITCQNIPVPMFESQISSWSVLGQATSDIPSAQLAAHLAVPGGIILVGAKYHLPYSPDGLHPTNEGYRHLGEDYAKAYRRVVLEGGSWEPLRPLSVTRSGVVITVRFSVPAPPLVLDTTRVTNPGQFGFEYVDASARPAQIVSVSLTGPDTATITLSEVPTASGKRLRYAFTAAPGNPAGPATGPRGNLRDSDPTVSRHGYELFNWAVHFDEPVP